jgi:hypothetical protein
MSNIMRILAALGGADMGELLLLLILGVFISTLCGTGVFSNKKDAAL